MLINNNIIAVNFPLVFKRNIHVKVILHLFFFLFSMPKNLGPTSTQKFAMLKPKASPR